MGSVPILALALLLPGAALAQDGQWGLNVYGFSYHFDRDKARARGVDNEFNPGLGLRWRKSVEQDWDVFLDGGVYRDSGRNTAVYAGGGAMFHLSPRFKAGLALAAFQSDTYNDGNFFIAPLPVLGYDFDRVSLNLVYLPKFKDYNTINTLGFWLTVWMR